MPAHLSEPAVLAVAVAAFVAVLLLIEALSLLWRRNFGSPRRRIERRLQRLAQEKQALQASLMRQGERQASMFDRWARHLAGHHRLALWLQQAQLGWGLGRLLAASLLLGLLGHAAVAGVAADASLAALAAGLLLAASPWAHVAWRRQQRLARVQSQLPDALDLMGRALQAGHALSSALQMVAEEMPDPIATEFKAVHDAVNFGMGLPQAFAGLTERVPLSDLRYFVVAVLIQRESGGNLAELLASLACLIRERLKLQARVKVLSAEGRLSAWILVVLPFALGGLMAFFNPEFMSPLWTDPLGISLLHWMLGLMALGLLLIRNIVRLRV